MRMCVIIVLPWATPHDKGIESTAGEFHIQEEYKRCVSIVNLFKLTPYPGVFELPCNVTGRVAMPNSPFLTEAGLGGGVGLGLLESPPPVLGLFGVDTPHEKGILKPPASGSVLVEPFALVRASG